MKTRHSITTILVALIALIGLSGCNHSVKELVVTPKQSTVPIGFQQQLKAEKVYKKGKVVDATHMGSYLRTINPGWLKSPLSVTLKIVSSLTQ